MLVLHCGLDIPVTHCSHDSRQVPGSLENSSPIVVPAAIENKIFGKPGFSSGFPEPIRHRREVSALCSLRWEDPSFASCAAPRFQDVECTIAHRHPSSPLCCLAVGNEDDAASPIQVLYTYPVQFSFVSHTGVAHQNHDVLEKLPAAIPPVALGGARQEFLFRVLIEPPRTSLLFFQLQFRSMANQFPFLCLVKHSPQGSQSTIGIRRRSRKGQGFGNVLCDLIQSHPHN